MDYQIRKRVTKTGDPRFSVVLELWVDGSRKIVSGGTHGTEKEAVRAGEKLLLQYDNSSERLKALHGSMTLKDWAAEWVSELTMKQSTIAAYEWRIQHWVLPFLGSIKLKDLTPQMIDNWLQGLPLSRSSKQCALDSLRNSLNKAVSRGFLTSNPTTGIRIEATKSQKKAEKHAKKVKTWNYEEVQTMLDLSVGLPVEPLVIFGLLAGLRPGEAMVVRWSDIDWVAGTVTVGRTISRNEKMHLVVTETTKNGEVRKARLTSDAVFRLMRIKETRNDAEDATIYNMVTGSATIWRQVKSLCRMAEIKSLPPHSLRHTHASMLLENGATLAAVAKQLGHSNPTITSSVYWHLIDETNDSLSGVMDRALSKNATIEVGISI